jgi:predicted kinase
VLAAPVLAWDWVMAGMTSFERLQVSFGLMDREHYRQVGWSILWNLSIAQLRSGRSVVLDGVARESELDRLHDVAAEHDARAVVVWTECSDRDVHRSRVVGRVRAIPGWHELDWEHVDALRSSLVPPSRADLRLDAVEPLETNVDRLRALLSG